MTIHLNLRAIAAATAISCVLACGGAERDHRLRVGNEPDDSSGAAGDFGNGNGNGNAADGGIGSGENALSVRVHDVEDMVIEVITLACAGDCADVKAVARGGNPPYTFAWEDGSSHAQRHVCLDSSKRLEVSATDTAIDSDEFRYDAHTATAEVSATVLACNGDGGTAPGDCLFENPSLEGTPATNTTGKEFDAAPWQACDLTPDLTSEQNESGTGGQPATDGETYLYLGVATLFGSESIAQPLCSPLLAGQTRYVSVDLQPYVPGAGTALQIFGSSSSLCAEDELLGESAVVTETAKWTTVCFALHASADRTFGKVQIKETLGGALVDNLRVVAACP